MTVQISMFLLTVCSVLTSLITQALKKMMTIKKPTITAAIVSVVVGIAVPVGYIIINKMPFMAQDSVYVISLVVLTWLCATLGYDKVIEAIKQIGVSK